MGNRIFASEGGQAAAGDISNLNFHMEPVKPESQMQAEFAQRTGIWCPKPAREWLENLMENHRFTAKELSIAWKAGSVGWNSDRDAKKLVTPWIEAAFGYSIAMVAAVFFLALSLPTISSTPPTIAQVSVLLGSGAVFLGVCWMANRFMLWPRRVALRIRRVSQDVQ